MHILLIDDSSSTRSLLRTLINSGQAVRHEISEASSGEEALQKVGSGEINLPDLVILDINMGGMSGYELCREFRQRYKTSSDVVPYIIIVTANEGVDVINQALESGANDYMPKPVNVKVLQVRLRVAERMLSMAQASGATPIPPPVPPAPIITGITPEEHQAAIDAAVSEALAHHIAINADSPKEIAEFTGNVTGSPRESQIGSAIEQADSPIALVSVEGAEPSFQIVYANSAMTSTTQFEYDQLIGRSLAEMEAWTPDFLRMVLGYVHRGAILSHVPMWSQTRQAVPVHLSFYPVRAEDDTARHYLVIHHF